MSVNIMSTRISGARDKSPGWAAFDIKQRQKQKRGVANAPETDNEAYPSLPSTSTLTSLRPCYNMCRNTPNARSFSSVILTSEGFPTLSEERDCVPGNSYDNKIVDKTRNSAFKKLKALYSWADYSLVEDVMAAVNDDVDNASRLLESMGSSQSNEKRIREPSFTSKGFLVEGHTLKAGKGAPFGMGTDFAKSSSTGVERLHDENGRLATESTSSGKLLCDNIADIESMLEHLRLVIPIEPEWEEDDVYLRHRKDAIKAMRSAAHSSKIATNCFLRGDHVSAQQHSLKAQEEWSVAEKLNARAAKEILSIRNMDNDIWKLDLHGLHAVEAVQALQERLWKIENQFLLNRLISPNKCKTSNGMARSSSFESFSNTDVQKLDRLGASSRHRPGSLQVITGKGNHSRGGAAIPAAVRSFLNENGYLFDESRAGVVIVKPKLRIRNEARAGVVTVEPKLRIHS